MNLGSQEQAHAIEQIGRAIVQMEQVSHSTAAQAQESAAAAEQLNAQTYAVKDAVADIENGRYSTRTICVKTRKAPSATSRTPG